MNTANKLTVLRVILVPVFVLIMLIWPAKNNIVALIIFIIASLTDYLDGYVARHYNQTTDFGKFLDPLADKLLVMAALLIFVGWGQMPSWCAMIIIAREFAVSGLRMVAASSGLVIAAAWSGKIKTASSLVAICIMLLGSLHGIVLFGSFTLNTLCIIVMLVTTIWSGAEYFIKNKHVLKGKAGGDG